MKTLSILISLFIFTLTQISSAAPILRGQCNETHSNIQNLEKILDDFKPGTRLLDESKELISKESGFDITSRKTMTNGLRIKIIKKVSFLQNTLKTNCNQQRKVSNSN